MHRFLVALLLTQMSLVAVADALVVSSGKRQVSLVEMYTSEGCSSCPPADRWLAGFIQNPDLWRSVVPLGFHVDYWNNLGWPDKFSDAAYSARQRELRQQGNLAAVYTPGILVNGKEWRGLLEREPFPRQARRLPGELTLAVNDRDVTVRFEGDASRGMIANLVLLGTGIESPVPRGENAGKLLRHEFVVLDHKTRDGTGVWQFEIQPDEQATAIAAWVSTRVSLVPIQAVGTWLPVTEPVSHQAQ